MWTCPMPDAPKCLELGINIISEDNIGGLVIWNYNKSLLESIKGIKHIEILVND